MVNSNLTYRCYILPIVAAIIYILFSVPAIDAVFKDWVPDYSYRIFIKSIVLLVILFLICRGMDIYWTDMCHDNTCIKNNTSPMNDIIYQSSSHSSNESNIDTLQTNISISTDNTGPNAASYQVTYTQDIEDSSNQRSHDLSIEEVSSIDDIKGYVNQEAYDVSKEEWTSISSIKDYLEMKSDDDVTYIEDKRNDYDFSSASKISADIQQLDG